MISKNKYLFNRQAIEILPVRLKICKKIFFDSMEYEISFEKLDNKIKVQTSVRNGLLIIAFFFTVLGILFLTGTEVPLDLAINTPTLMTTTDQQADK